MLTPYKNLNSILKIAAATQICLSAPTQTSLKWFIEKKKKPLKPHRHFKMMKMVHHSQILSPNQCGSTVVQSIHAPLPLVWSLIRDFRVPQGYKQFIKRCFLSSGDGCAGSVRELTLVSGLPAHRSTERLDRLDDDLHVMVVTIIGGDHKLVNYQSTVSLHEGDGGETVVVESYVVDVPADSSGEDTCLFADTIIKCNLKSLAKITEKMRVVG